MYAYMVNNKVIYTYHKIVTPHSRLHYLMGSGVGIGGQCQLRVDRCYNIPLHEQRHQTRIVWE